MAEGKTNRKVTRKKSLCREKEVVAGAEVTGKDGEGAVDLQMTASGDREHAGLRSVGK